MKHERAIRRELGIDRPRRMKRPGRRTERVMGENMRGENVQDKERLGVDDAYSGSDKVRDRPNQREDSQAAEGLKWEGKEGRKRSLSPAESSSGRKKIKSGNYEENMNVNMTMNMSVNINGGRGMTPREADARRNGDFGISNANEGEAKGRNERRSVYSRLGVAKFRDGQPGGRRSVHERLGVRR